MLTQTEMKQILKDVTPDGMSLSLKREMTRGWRITFKTDDGMEATSLIIDRLNTTEASHYIKVWADFLLEEGM